MSRKATTFRLTRAERDALRDAGAGSMREGVSRLIEKYLEKKPGAKKLVLPDDPLLARVYRRLIGTSVADDDGVHRLNLDVLLGDLSSSLKIPKESAKELIRKLVEREFGRMEQGMREVVLLLKPEFEGEG